MMATKKRERATIRLACSNCDYNGNGGCITPSRLRKIKRSGWKYISRQQTLKQATKVYDDPRDAPPGYSVFDWHTHMGLCPDCIAAGADE